MLKGQSQFHGEVQLLIELDLSMLVLWRSLNGDTLYIKIIECMYESRVRTDSWQLITGNNRMDPSSI